MRLLVVVLGFAAALAGAACGNGHHTPSPTEPTPPQTFVDIAGTWLGQASDSSGPGEMTWQLSQNAGSVTGTLTLRDTDTGLNGQGTITGTISGSSLAFSIAIPAGGFDAPFGTCTGTASGTANLSSTAITATYTGTNSCTGTIASGQLTLSKQ